MYSEAFNIQKQILCSLIHTVGQISPYETCSFFKLFTSIYCHLVVLTNNEFKDSFNHILTVTTIKCTE